MHIHLRNVVYLFKHAFPICAHYPSEETSAALCLPQPFDIAVFCFFSVFLPFLSPPSPPLPLLLLLRLPIIFLPSHHRHQHHRHYESDVISKLVMGSDMRVAGT